MSYVIFNKMSKIFHTNIEKDTIENANFRKVIHTTTKMQLVLMSLKKGDNIPNEVHEDNDQFIRIEIGQCKIVTPAEEFYLEKDEVVIIPAGTYHEVINTGNSDLKLYTIYAPPHHPDLLIQKDKPIDGGGIRNKKTIIVDKHNLDNLLKQSNKLSIRTDHVLNKLYTI